MIPLDTWVTKSATAGKKAVERKIQAMLRLIDFSDSDICAGGLLQPKNLSWKLFP